MLARRTKIVATLGPASHDEAQIEALLRAGANVVRINCSHGGHDEHGRAIAAVRRASTRLGLPIGVLLDLPGPKLRLGDLASPIEVAAGDLLTLGDGADLPVNRAALVSHLRPGQKVLIDDGAVALTVVERQTVGTTVPQVVLRVANAGVLSSRKGVNLPDTILPISSVTPEDEDHLAFGIEHDVDLVAQSFVRSAADVLRLKESIAAAGGDQPVVAKIEKKEALPALDEIVAVADAVMVARGDLGVEISAAEVPVWQKRIIHAAVKAGKPVITATQMLQSMITEVRPTRAEVSDVANAIYDSTCAVMLSGETAVGAFPVEAVATMASIAGTVEADIESEGRSPQSWALARESISGAISYGACDVARKMGASAIITATSSGATALSVAKYRPSQPIIAVSPNPQTVRRLALAWGVTPLYGGRAHDADGVIADAAARALEAGLVKPGQTVVITAGVHTHRPGATNLIQARVL